MINNTKQAVRLSLFFTIFLANLTAYAAPRIPKEILNTSLVYCTNASNFSFNPQKNDLGTNINIVTAQLYDKLVEVDPITKKIKPVLAKDYYVSQDGLEITFNLRKNVKFHTTKWFTPTRNLNADDVLFSLKKMMGHLDHFTKRKELDEIRDKAKKGYNTYYQKQMSYLSLSSVSKNVLSHNIIEIKAPSKYVVKIKLAQPDALLLTHLASQYAVIYSKEYANQLYRKEKFSQLDQYPIGTGVYQLQNYINHGYVRLKRNEDYWQQKANIENIVIDYSTNNVGKMAKFLNKECDIAVLPEPSQLSFLPRRYFITELGANLAFIAFNFQQEKMQNKVLREDILRAIDRYRLSRQIFYGLGIVADKILPTALLADNFSIDYQHDFIFKKKKRLRTPLKLWVIDEKKIYNYHPLKMGELIKFDLDKAGFDVEIRHVNRTFLAHSLATGKADYDMILTGKLANNYDPDHFLSTMLGCRSQSSIKNLANWCDEEFDALLNQARAEKEEKKRVKLYQELEILLREKLPILPLVNVNRLLVVNDRTKNVKMNAFGQVNLSQIQLNLD